MQPVPVSGVSRATLFPFRRKKEKGPPARRLHLPCLEGEKKLLFLSNCDRSISTHLQTYGLSKSQKDITKDITDEVDFLLCSEGKFILFSSLLCKVLGGKKHEVTPVASRRRI